MELLTINNNWDGSLVQLSKHQAVRMPQTDNNSMVLALVNTSPNSDGKISYSSGGSLPTIVNCKAGFRAPKIVVHNWNGNNLTVTNISSNDDTVISVVMYSRGSRDPQALPDDGKNYELDPFHARQTETKGNYVQFTVGSPRQYCVFITYAGNEKPEVWCVNAPDKKSLPDLGAEYDVVTSENTHSKVFFGGGLLYTVNATTNKDINGYVSLLNL